jgi:lambda repressor-like predicted transcriptional regulator
MLPNAGESAARIDTGMAIAKLSSDSPLSSNTLCSALETVTSSASFTVAPWL